MMAMTDMKRQQIPGKKRTHHLQRVQMAHPFTTHAGDIKAMALIIAEWAGGKVYAEGHGEEMLKITVP
jgi:hypothetical protein